MSEAGNDRHLRRVWRYYDRTESRLGYRLLLGETKHFGWYEPGQPKWRFAEAMHRMERQLGDRLGLPENADVLDAGCGVGNVARTMAREYGHRVTGIDILDFNLSKAMTRSRAEGLSDRARFLQADYHHLPFASGSFDGVYTMETFVHASDPERVLAEFFRVLRPRGTLVMLEYSRTPSEELSPTANRALATVCDLAAMPSWLRLNHGELERLLEKAGFSAVSATDVTARMLPMLRAFSLAGRLPYWIGKISGRMPKVVNALSGVEMYRHQDAWRYQIYTATKP